MSMSTYYWQGNRNAPTGSTGGGGGGGGGSPTYQTSGTGTSAASTTLTLTKPSGLTTGDLMLATCVGNPPGITWSRSGWTVVGSPPTSGPSLHLLWKIADGTDVAASSFDFTASSACNGAGGIMRISDAHATTPIAASAYDDAYSSTGTASATPDAPSSGTAASANYMGVAVIGLDNDRTMTPPTDYTEAFDLNDVNNVTAAGAYRTLSSATEADPGTWTISSSTPFAMLWTGLVAPA